MTTEGCHRFSLLLGRGGWGEKSLNPTHWTFKHKLFPMFPLLPSTNHTHFFGGNWRIIWIGTVSTPVAPLWCNRSSNSASEGSSPRIEIQPWSPLVNLTPVQVSIHDGLNQATNQVVDQPLNSMDPLAVTPFISTYPRWDFSLTSFHSLQTA